MSSYLRMSDGVYDPRRNFAVTNWSDEDFTCSWTGETTNDKGLVDGIVIDYTLHAGETKTYPQYLAYYITMNLVDREMYKIANAAPADSKERERLEMAVANKDLRKPYEDKTIQEVLEGQESPEVTAMREKLRKEILAENQQTGALSSEMHLNPNGTPKAPEDHAGEQDSAPVGEFADVPKKKGRPAKEPVEA